MHKDRPSLSARKVALNFVTLGEKPGMCEILPPGIVEATADLLVASGATVVRWCRSRRMVRVYEAFNWMMPGQFEAFGYRKAFCERQVRDGIHSGATQILVLGAGYDTLGWRLAREFSGVNFYETDHPATSRLKARGIEKMGQRANLHLIPEDLAKRKLADVLKAMNSWDPKAETVIIAEGLLMCLSPETVRDLFIQCAAIAGSGSRIAFTYMGTGKDDRPDVGRWSGLIRWILKASGEPWLWSIRPGELDRFLENTGWVNARNLGAPSNRHGVEFFGITRK